MNDEKEGSLSNTGDSYSLTGGTNGRIGVWMTPEVESDETAELGCK